MTYETGSLLNGIMICIAIIVWISLIFRAAIKLFKKDHLNFKRTFLYLINSAIFYLGVPFFVRLALQVQGPKETTKESSMQVLKNDCILEFVRYISISILVTAILFCINYLFQKYILKKIEKKTLSILAVIDFFILLLLSVLAIFNYYIAISGEIDSYHN